ncbi:MAG: IPT/TIG domain-containing protein [Dehalococcoidia bacterium]
MLKLMSTVLAAALLVVTTSASRSPARAESDVLISALTPDHGLTDAEIVTTISGSGFPTSDDCDGPIVEILFDGVSAFPLVPPTRTELKVMPPAHSPGRVDVTVRNLCNGSSDTLPAAYTYTAPTILGGSIPEDGGFGLFVFGGGSNEDLVEASGCPSATATFWATNSSGQFVTFIPGAAVHAVNDAWNQLFPQGVPFNTALIGRCL